MTTISLPDGRDGFVEVELTLEKDSKGYVTLNAKSTVTGCDGREWKFDARILELTPKGTIVLADGDCNSHTLGDMGFSIDNHSGRNHTVKTVFNNEDFKEDRGCN